MNIKGLLGKLQSSAWIWPCFFISLIYIFDSRYFSSPPLFDDEWETLIRGYLDGYLRIIDLSITRPLILAPFSVLTSFFGLQLQYFYVVNFLLIFFSAILLYFILIRAFPKYPWLYLPIVLIFLIYPVVYNRTWLLMIIYHFVLSVSLGVIWLLINFSKSGRPWQLFLALALFLFSLGFFEGGLGVVMLTGLLLACLTQNIPLRRRLTLLSVFLVSGFFIVWRTFIQHRIMNIQDDYYNQLDISVLAILYGYIRGLFVFIFSWFGPILGLGLQGWDKYVVFIAIGASLLCAFMASLPRLIKQAKADTLFVWDDRKALIRSLWIIFLIGGFFWVAGYIPIIALRSPAFDLDTSRDNLFAVAGASISLVAGLSCILALTTRSVERLKTNLLVFIIPFIILGMFYQLWSQNERFNAWNEKKQFWNLMFQAVPDLKDNSEVVIVLPQDDQLGQFQIFPFWGNWEARACIQILYNNPTLTARYYYPNLPQSEKNRLSKDWDWSKIIIVYYDSRKPSLEIIKRLDERLLTSFSTPGYLPENRFINQSPNILSYRWLVK